MSGSIRDMLQAIWRDNEAEIAAHPADAGPYQNGYADGLRAANQRVRAAMAGTYVASRQAFWAPGELNPTAGQAHVVPPPIVDGGAPSQDLTRLWEKDE